LTQVIPQHWGKLRLHDEMSRLSTRQPVMSQRASLCKRRLGMVETLTVLSAIMIAEDSQGMSGNYWLKLTLSAERSSVAERYPSFTRAVSV
jgi:hypothetical protein